MESNCIPPYCITVVDFFPPSICPLCLILAWTCPALPFWGMLSWSLLIMLQDALGNPLHTFRAEGSNPLFSPCARGLPVLPVLKGAFLQVLLFHPSVQRNPSWPNWRLLIVQSVRVWRFVPLRWVGPLPCAWSPGIDSRFLLEHVRSNSSSWSPPMEEIYRLRSPG